MADDIRINRAEQDLGMGQPPPANPDAAGEMIADECNTNAKIVVVEQAEYTIITPMKDADVGATLGNQINVWGVTDGQPPAGVANASNTLSTPGMPNSNMVLRGLQIAVRVEPEGRTIKGNFFDPGAVNSIPASFDVASLNDQAGGANGPQGLQTGQGALLPCELLWGLSTWKAALAFILGYQLNWFKDNQNSLLKDPLASIGCIEPFSEAMAAGTALGSNLDRIRDLNDRLLSIGMNSVMLPITHNRLGSVTVAGTNVGDFEISREQDASPTVFGGVGTPGNSFRNKPPFIFNTPIFWPLGQPLGMRFDVYNDVWQKEFQRWMSLTGATGGGKDLSLSIAQQFDAAGAGAAGYAPSNVGTNTALEQTLDLAPVNTSQQTQTKRAILKGGRIVISIGLVGRRIQDKWKPAVKSAIDRGAIQAPMGIGNL